MKTGDLFFCIHQFLHQLQFLFYQFHFLGFMITCDVNIQVHRHFDFTVPKDGLQCFGLHPAFNTSCGKRMPQQVYGETPYACPIANGIDTPIVGSLLD